MQRDIASQDLKVPGIMLRRTNYGEADRILNIITPEGKVSAIAKGVRKTRSRLAGGVEMFCLSDLQIHYGRSELSVITSARLVRSYGGILQDYERMCLAGMVLRKISIAAESSSSAEWFEITKQVLEALDDEMDVVLVETWFWLNLLRASGEEANLYRDASGEKLKEGVRYRWEISESAFVPHEQGEYGTDEIKMMRLISKGTNLKIIQKIKTEVDLWGKILNLAQIMAKK